MILFFLPYFSVFKVEDVTCVITHNMQSTCVYMKTVGKGDFILAVLPGATQS